MAGNHLYVGASRSGKTYAMQTHAKLAARAGWCILAMDIVDEWPEPKVWGRFRHTVTSDIGAAFRCVKAQRPLTIFRPGLRADHREYAETLATFAKAGPATILCIPEAQKAAPEGPRLTPDIDDLVHRREHKFVNARLWADTQQLADLKTEVLAGCTRIHLFGGADFRDGGRIRRWGGRELAEQVRECGRRASGGEKGWHVAIDPLNPAPPYKLERV